MHLFYALLFLTMATVLLARWGWTRVIASPPRLLFFANVIYFFVVYFFLVDDRTLAPYGYAILCAVLFVAAFVFAELLTSRQRTFRPPKRVLKLEHVRATGAIYLVFALIVAILFARGLLAFGTIDPLAAFSRSYLTTQGVATEAGGYVVALVLGPTSWFVFILALHRAMNFGALRALKVAGILVIFIYSQSFTGGKSFVILPVLIWFILFARTYKSGLALLPAVLATAFSNIVFQLLVSLNELRSGVAARFDWTQTFVARIDYIRTLSGYLDRHQQFHSLWPPLELLQSFVPSNVAAFLGIEKYRVSFDVLYTQFAFQDERLSSSAGVGLAATNETLGAIGLDFPVLAAVISGLLAHWCTEKLHLLLNWESRSNGIVLFATFVPALHIIGFFETGPTLFFRLLFYPVLLLLIVYPLLSALGSLEVDRRTPRPGSQ